MSDSEQLSKRALEAYDALPGDSESTVDYPANVTNVTNMTNPFAALPEYFEIEVQMTVRLPDGMTIEYRETVEKEAPDDYDFPEVAELADQVNRVIQSRLG